MFKKILIILTFTFLIGTSSNIFAYWIIANKEVNKEEILSKKNIFLIFSLKKNFWNNGTPITVITLNTDNRIHQLFVDNVLGLNYVTLQNIWDLKIYSGTVVPPITVRTKEELIEMIKLHEGSIGYIYSNHIPNVITFEIESE